MSPSEDQWLEFCSHLKAGKYEKGELFAEQGEDCENIAFIYKGIFVF